MLKRVPFGGGASGEMDSGGCPVHFLEEENNVKLADLLTPKCLVPDYSIIQI